MRYIDISAPGGPEVLQLRQAAAPEPREGEVLIKVAAAGVNRPDIFQREGFYPPPVGASTILGLEVAGTVAALGRGPSPWRIEDRVCALTNGGGYAEYVAVPASQCLPVPKGLGLIEAAALPETCFTVWSNVFERAGLQAGQTFLVHGGAGGIGTTAIQMARALGARVFATAGTDAKCRVCRKIGARIAVNYRQQDFVAVLLEATQEKGVDVILDMVGGDYVARHIELAAMEGRIVNIAFLQGAKIELNLMPIMLKRLTLTGSTLRPQSENAKARLAAALRNHIWPLIEAGQMGPLVARTFPLEEAAAAHRLMESNTHIGKIILTVAE